MKDQEAIQWRLWDAKAFQEARNLHKPIFLSISAAWCHWCHVMDEESFTHPEIIRRINTDFIPVRVDSDKRPDINSRYNMGGWPTVAILNLEGKVTAGGTYMPLGQLLSMLSSAKQDPDEVRQDPAASSPEVMKQTPDLSESLVETVGGFLKRSFDPEFGGFGGPPKFPQGWTIELVFHLGLSTGDNRWSEMAIVTLDNMQGGGIYDPVDGGFFRYATRGDWDNPHYEKLLETNARMLSLYLRAYLLTGQTAYRATAQGILDYLFFVLFVTEGSSLSSLVQAEPDSKRQAIPEQAWFSGSQSADQDYYNLMEEDRIEADPPSLDRTIYTDSNAIAASAVLAARHVLGDSKYQDMALKLIDFLWAQFYQAGQGMFHYREALNSPVRMLLGHLADQVSMIMALIDAFEATGSKLFLSRTEELAKVMERYLWDDEKSGYWDLPMDSQALGVLKIRIKPFVDNASAAIALTRLYHLTGEQIYQKRAEGTLRYLATVFTVYKQHAAPFAVAVERFLKPPHHITVVGKRGDIRWMELLSASHRLKVLWKVVLPLDQDEDSERLKYLGYSSSDEPLAYLCIGKICLPPISRPEDLTSVVERFKV